MVHTTSNRRWWLTSADGTYASVGITASTFAAKITAYPQTAGPLVVYCYPIKVYSALLLQNYSRKWGYVILLGFIYSKCWPCKANVSTVDCKFQRATSSITTTNFGALLRLWMTQVYSRYEYTTTIRQSQAFRRLLGVIITDTSSVSANTSTWSASSLLGPVLTFVRTHFYFSFQNKHCTGIHHFIYLTTVTTSFKNSSNLYPCPLLV